MGAPQGAAPCHLEAEESANGAAPRPVRHGKRRAAGPGPPRAVFPPSQTAPERIGSSPRRTILPLDPGDPAIDSKILAAAAARLADEKKAEDILIVDVSERLKVADYFVIVTGQSRTHVRALVDELHVRMKAAGERHLPVEGAALGWWVVLDYGDVVIHVMQPEAREFYDLDRLYGDCPHLEDWASLAPALPMARELAPPAG
ncbi:MAG: ribosome silencing factor [Planctomycetota bacterium]